MNFIIKKKMFYISPTYQTYISDLKNVVLYRYRLIDTFANRNHYRFKSMNTIILTPHRLFDFIELL